MIDTTHLKSHLTALLTAVEAELRTLGIQEMGSGDWIATPDDVDEFSTADPNDNADTVEDWNERRAILSQLETRYHNLQRAIKKVDDGTYGICEISGEPIEEDRLAANPAARTCKAHLEQETELPL